jgi:hypothetical protein
MESVLVILACLVTGDQCQVHVLTDAMPLPACMAASQPAAAQWAGEHPNRKILKIACADPRQIAAFLGRTQA